MTLHTHEPVEPTGSQVNVSGGRTYVAGESPWAPARRVVALLFGVLVTLIGLRIVLLLLGANAGNGLVDAIYAITQPLVEPFRGVFNIDQVAPNGQNVLDVAALVAIIGWSLIAVLIIAILRLPDRRDV
jgi:YggT family protein